MRKTSWLVLVAAASVLAGCAGLVRERIYRPEPIAAEAPSWPGIAPREVTAQTEDGLSLRGYYWPPSNGSDDILVFFHGNGGNRRTAAQIAQPLSEGGRGVLVACYRGYGDNPGQPSEAGLFADGAAFAALARRLHPRGKLYLFGWSMGGAVALELAGRIPVDGVATFGTFTRLADVAPGIAGPFLPDRFDNVAAIRRIEAPVFLFHGDQDAVVPYAHAARLRDASNGRATVVTVRGGGHQPGLNSLAPIVWRALEGRGPPPT
jgi:uncharacterized protein